MTFDEFCELFEVEARRAGGELDGREVLTLLAGDVREEMVEAIRRCRERLKTAAITNNWAIEDDGDRPLDDLARSLFDVVLESSKLGLRKPDPRIYELACEELDVEPAEAVFLDDIGANLKPARAMGMTTIKVTDPAEGVRSYHAALEKLKIKPYRSLNDDLMATQRGTAYGVFNAAIGIMALPASVKIFA